ncbi:MAG: ABC-2 transporter permease [Oscillospiraceae bacterium]
MKGLILKDLYTIKTQAKMYLIIMFGLCAVTIINGGNGGSVGGMICVLAAMLPITALAYDERSKWEHYALTMPVSRRDMVLSKYILGIIAEVATLVLSMAIMAITSKNIVEAIGVSFVFFAIGIFIMSFLLPIMFKVGVEKGRVLMIIILLLPTFLIIFLNKLNIPAPSGDFLKYLIYLSPVILLAIFVLSIFVSIAIYKKKEM